LQTLTFKFIYLLTTEDLPMSDFKVTPEVELSTAQMLERYQLQDETTLRRWAKLHGINSSRGFFYPSEVDLMDHAHHHIYNLGMSIADYQSLLDRRRSQSQTSGDRDKTVASQVADEAYDAIEMLTDQYSEAIDLMGERIADHFIDELDLSVMRHLSKKVKDRRTLNGQAKKPNRFLQVIKAVLQPSNENTLLVPKKADDPSLELEHHHRLG
jgi:DNA-binding transcriptional MerR regulator